MKLLALVAAITLTGCASICPEPPDPPVWALATVPDDATPGQAVMYAIAEIAQHEAYEAELIAVIRVCRK